MSRNIFLVLILTFVLSLAFNTGVQADYEGDDYIEMGDIHRIRVVDADKISYSEKAINKLDRGVINGATFWLEIPAEVAKVSKEQNPFMGATVGVVHGTITSVVRAGSALFDIFTFCVPPYDKPVMKPEYALNRADEKIKEFLW